MRRGGQVEEHRAPGDVLADRHIQRVAGRLRFGCTHDVAQADQLPGVVRYLHANGRTARNGRQDAHIGGRHRIRNVAVEAGDARYLHAGPELQLVAGDCRADCLTDQLGVNTVRGQRLDQRATASFDFCLVDGLRSAARQVAERRQSPLPGLCARAEIEHFLLPWASWQLGHTPGRTWALRLRPCAVQIRGAPLVVIGEVVQLRCWQLAGAFASDMTVALQCRDVAEHLLHLAPDGGGNGSNAMGRLPRRRLQRGARQQQDGAEEHGGQKDNGTCIASQAAQRLADERPEPAAGATEGVEVAHDLLGLAHHVQQAENRKRGQPPADAQAEAIAASSLAHQRDSDGDERDRHHEAAQAGEPTNEGLDSPTQRTCQVEVDAEAEQHTDNDEPDTDELVFATGHGLAHLCRGLIATRSGPRRRLGTGFRTGTSTRARCTAACGHGRLRALVRLTPCTHCSHGTKGARCSTRTRYFAALRSRPGEVPSIDVR